MGYTSPYSSWITGDIPTAADLNVLASDVKWLAEEHPSARVYNSADISIAVSGTPQVLTFNSERWDIGGCHSTVTATSKLTVPTGGDGVYDIGGCGFFEVDATGDRGLHILLNGTTVIGRTAVDNAGASLGTGVTVVTKYRLVAGDYVELVALQRSGGALDLSAIPAYSPEFWFEWRQI